MNMPILTFFNNRGGVGKTSLIYHLAWMFARLDKRVLVVDLDPQANLTAAFLEEEVVAELWNSGQGDATIFQCVQSLAETGVAALPSLQTIATNLSLLPGDINLAPFENTLADAWAASSGDGQGAHPLRLLSAFRQIMLTAAEAGRADIVLVDTGANLGPINRSVLLASDAVALPLGSDLCSLQGLRGLGSTLRSWRASWRKRLERRRNSGTAHQEPEFALPEGVMRPIGYLCRQCDLRLERPIRVLDQWARHIPARYRECVVGESAVEGMTPENDAYCLAVVRPYRSLAAMARECRKPIFSLTTADGAIGTHAEAVQGAKRDFRRLAETIADKVGLVMADEAG